MKKLLLVLVCVALTTVLFVGCIPGITPTPEPEPESVMEAMALAELVKVGEGEEAVWTIEWSIINTGDVFIREYTLTFEVYYPMKDYVIVTHEGKYLEVRDMDSGKITLVQYDIPESVSVTWKLSE